MSDNASNWRQAIHDKTDPLHSITWSLFSPKFKTERIAATYANQREMLRPYLKQIMATKMLYEKGALGSGHAPANAARLRFFWQGMDILPDVLQMLTQSEVNTPASEVVFELLVQMPEEAIDSIIHYGQQCKEDDKLMIAAILSTKLGQGNQECFDFIRSAFEAANDHAHRVLYAQALIDNDVEQAEPYLKSMGRKKKYKSYRDLFQELITDYKLGLA